MVVGVVRLQLPVLAAPTQVRVVADLEHLGDLAEGLPVGDQRGPVPGGQVRCVAAKVGVEARYRLRATRPPQRPCEWYHIPYQSEGAVGVVVTASDARRNLFPLIEQVNNDRQPVEITSKRGDAVLMARADYDALEATAYLLRVPANARRLLESLEQARAGDRKAHELA